MKRVATEGLVCALVVFPTAAAAQNGIKITGLGTSSSVPWGVVVLLTLLTLLPALLLCMTPLVRLLVVFHFLRQALGTQTAPTNQTLIGLSLILTWFLMQPVLASIQQVAIVPFQQGRVSAMDAVERGSVPLRDYMLHYARAEGPGAVRGHREDSAAAAAGRIAACALWHRPTSCRN